jgi:hypothetical protein
MAGLRRALGLEPGDELTPEELLAGISALRTLIDAAEIIEDAARRWLEGGR